MSAASAAASLTSFPTTREATDAARPICSNALRADASLQMLGLATQTSGFSGTRPGSGCW